MVAGSEAQRGDVIRRDAGKSGGAAEISATADDTAHIEVPISRFGLTNPIPMAEIAGQGHLKSHVQRLPQSAPSRAEPAEPVLPAQAEEPPARVLPIAQSATGVVFQDKLHKAISGHDTQTNLVHRSKADDAAHIEVPISRFGLTNPTPMAEIAGQGHLKSHVQRLPQSAPSTAEPAAPVLPAQAEEPSARVLPIAQSATGVVFQDKLHKAISGHDTETNLVHRSKADDAAHIEVPISRFGLTNPIPMAEIAGQGYLKSHVQRLPQSAPSTAGPAEPVLPAQAEKPPARVLPIAQSATGAVFQDKLHKTISGHDTQTNLVHRSKVELGMQLSPRLAESAIIATIPVPRSAESVTTKTEIVAAFTSGEHSPAVPLGDRIAISHPAESTAVTALPGPTIATTVKPVSPGNSSVDGNFAHAQYFVPISAWRRPASAELPTHSPIVHRSGGLPAIRYMSQEKSAQLSMGTSNAVRFPHQALAPHASSTMPPSLLLMRQALIPASTVPDSGLRLSPSAGIGPAGSATGLSSFSGTRDLPSSSAAGTAPKAPELNQLANRVYELLVKRLASERQRRGF
jgi:hypothetical protein